MRVTIPHNKGEQEIRRIADETVTQLLNMTGPGFRLTGTDRKWDGQKLTFSLTASVGPFHTPITGWILCTATDVTIDVDLPPLLARLLPEQTLRQGIEQRVRGLLGK